MLPLASWCPVVRVAFVRCVMVRRPHDSGTFSTWRGWVAEGTNLTEAHMHGLIYLIGLIVVILAILSFFGLR
jgi:hypothetical protein